MRIAIDARLYQESGIGRYIRNLLANLEKLDNQNSYFILLLKKDFDNLNFRNNFKKVLADFKWYGITEQLKIPKILKQLDLDLLHFPHFNVPIFYRGKFIVTIHDLIHQHFQMRRATLYDPLTYKIKQAGYNAIFKNAIKKSGKILVPSNYVRDLLIQEWKIDSEKIAVTYEAVDDKIATAVAKVSTAKAKLVLNKFNIKGLYLFYVGNAHPHKNLEGLIKAFLEIKKSMPELKLVLAGNDHYFWQRLRKEFKDESVIFTGEVSDVELVALYKEALCFVMPSYEEGFGIPILEAMTAGCPIVSSNAGSLPEIGGDACLYFDPHNTPDMVEKIKHVLNNEKVRKELIEKGKNRVKQFSWEKLAKETLEEYTKCV